MHELHTGTRRKTFVMVAIVSSLIALLCAFVLLLVIAFQNISHDGAQYQRMAKNAVRRVDSETEGLNDLQLFYLTSMLNLKLFEMQKFARSKDYEHMKTSFNEAVRFCQALFGEKSSTLGTVFQMRGVIETQFEKWKSAEDYLTKSLAIDSDNCVALEWRAYVYVYERHYEKALADYTRKINLEPTADSYERRAGVYADLRQYQKSVDDATQAIRLEPNQHRHFESRAIFFNDLKQYQNAIDDYDKAIRLCPTAWALGGRAHVYAHLKQCEKSIADLSQAISLDNEGGSFYVDRAAVYASLGKNREAVNDCSKAIELDPKNNDAYDERQFAYTKLGQFAKAVEDGDKSLAIDPSNSVALRQRGYAWSRLGQYSRAIEDCTKANLQWEEPDNYSTIGYAYQKLGKLKEAQEAYAKADKLISRFRKAP